MPLIISVLVKKCSLFFRLHNRQALCSLLLPFITPTLAVQMVKRRKVKLGMLEMRETVYRSANTGLGGNV